MDFPSRPRKGKEERKKEPQNIETLKTLTLTLREHQSVYLSLPHTMEDLLIDLDDSNGSSAQLSCTFIAAGPGAPLRTLIIFLNAIDSPQTAWYPLIRLISQQLASRNSPPMLMYDRVGQGDSTGSNTPNRDVMAAVMDLRRLVERIAELKLKVKRDEVNTIRTMLVGSSIGCSIARLYAQTFPRTIGGLLLLDPIPTNRDMLSLFPDMRTPVFSNSPLPSPITPSLLEETREIVRRDMCNNAEGLWTANICDYLPFSSLPKLLGPKPNTPLVTVIVHDPDVFALEIKQVSCDRKFPTQSSVTDRYLETRVRRDHDENVYHTFLARIQPRSGWNYTSSSGARTYCGERLWTHNTCGQSTACA